MNDVNHFPALLVSVLRARLSDPLDHLNVRCIKRGKWCNANVYKVSSGGHSYVIKEFHSCHRFVCATIGRFLIRREFKALSQLQGLPGVSTGIRRLTGSALMVDYIPGRSLTEWCAEKHLLTRGFFEEMERRVECIHQAGFVHLDLRNLGNTIVGPDEKPYLIDFQSYIRTRHIPYPLRRWIEETDYSGIFKGWSRLCREPLDNSRATRLEQFDKIRRLWVLKGYWFEKVVWKRDGARRDSSIP